MKINIDSKFLVFVVIVAFWASLLPSAADHLDQPKTVEAERFVLRDKTGRVRATLEMREDGSPVFSLYGKDESRRLLEISSDPDAGARIILRGVNSNQDLMMDSNPTGASLTLHARGGKPRISIGSDVSGNPSIVLLDENMVERLFFGFAIDGKPTFEIRDQGQKRRLALQLSAGGEPTLELRDQAGKPIFRAPNR